MDSRKADRDRIVSRQARELMARKGVTQTVVAHALGVTQPGLSRTLSGGRQWRVDELVRLAEVLGVSVDDLVSP